jgi:site-specific DNA-methyltransferase (adenine-specific)
MLANDVKVKALIKSFVNKQAEGQYPSTCKYQHHIHTPFGLCAEILQQIPTGKYDKYLVMFNVEFVYELSKLVDFGKAEVYYYTTNTELAALATKLCPLVKILDEIEDMKFDVIVGNPPYQDSEAKSSKKMWPKFVHTSMSLLKQDGHLAMITPASWLAGKSDVFDLFKTNQCKYLNTDASSFFPQIGSTFSVYVLQKSKVTSPTVTTDGIVVDFREVDSLPKTITNTALSIFGKLNNAASAGLLAVQYDSQMHSQRTDRVSKTRDSVHVYPNKHGASTLVWSTVPHRCASTKKVMFYMSGQPKPFYDAGEYGASQHHGYVEVNNELEANNLIGYLSSKLIKYAIAQSTFAQAWNTKYIKELPKVDLTRSWTDAELYAHFNLTQEEIDYIELTVK